MEAKIKVNETTNQFELDTPQGLALIAYELENNTMSILHTEVPEEMEGKGIGSDLAKFALDYAREKHLKVKVYCQFVKVYLKRHSEYQDLIVD